MLVAPTAETLNRRPAIGTDQLSHEDVHGDRGGAAIRAGLALHLDVVSASFDERPRPAAASHSTTDRR